MVIKSILFNNPSFTSVKQRRSHPHDVTVIITVGVYRSDSKHRHWTIIRRQLGRKNSRDTERTDIDK